MNISANSDSDRKALVFAMNLSLGVGLLMFVIKMGAYLLTGSFVTTHLECASDHETLHA